MSLDLRKQILQKRKQVTQEEWRELGACAVQKLLQSTQWEQLFQRESIRVGLYRSMSDEPILKDFEDFVRQHPGMHLYYPRVCDVQARKMEWVEVSPHCAGKAWVRGAYGILEPQGELPAASEEEIKAFDLIFVPGTVFGEDGARWGRGAGYYDRFLSQVRRAIRVAVAFEFQLISELKQESWDQKVDWIITESREIRTPEFLEKWKLILK